MGHKRIKVGVGLSGGVDSSVAAALLNEEGYDVTGIAMKIFDGSVPIEETRKHACYGPGEQEDVEVAASVCKKLNIPLYVVDLRKKYRQYVIGYFKREYLAGRTPNPCIVCNQRLKFGFLLDKARQAGADFDLFATGHYAQTVKSGNRYLLKKARDSAKDQSYFLYTLRQDQLAHTLFPVGGLSKDAVRNIAQSLGFETAGRPESQDFIAGGDYSLFFSEKDLKEGDIVDEQGNILGKHRGIIHYTVGQRRGLGLCASKPLYVARIDAEKNRVVVGGKEKLFSKGLIAGECNLIALDRLDKPYRVKARVRLKHKDVDATVLPCEGAKARVLFDEPQASVTPGQSVVLYSEDVVLGGGIIQKAI